MTAQRVVIGVLLLWAAIPARAQQPDAEQALKALRQMEAAYKSVDALHVRIAWSAKYGGSMSANEFPLPGPETLELKMQRPNKFFMSATTKRLGSSSSYMVVSDGTTLSYWRSSTNTYVQVMAPPTLAGMVKLLPTSAIGTIVNGSWQADSILEWDAIVGEGGLIAPSASAASGQLAMGEPETLGNTKVTVVRVAPPARAVPFRVEQRFYLDPATSLVRGLATSARGRHPDNGRDFSVEMLARYDVFTAQPAFSDTDFTFVPPRGAKPAPR